MKKELLYLELIWWFVTAIVTYMVIKPIVENFGTAYPFLIWNIICVVLLITYARHIFLLKHTFLANAKWGKIALLVLSVPYLFLGMEQVVNFQTFWDNGEEVTLIPMLLHPLSLDARNNLFAYLETETLFFGVAALIVGVLMPIRLAVSFWREKNRGTV